jgi:hypothetical protein
LGRLPLFIEKIPEFPNCHESANDPWPYVNFTLSMLKLAYHEFVERVGHIQVPRGAKTKMVLSALACLPREFTVAQIEKATLGVSREMLRHVLHEQKGQKHQVHRPWTRREMDQERVMPLK